MSGRRVVMLAAAGPSAPIADVVAEVAPDGPVVTVRAGRQEWESEAAPPDWMPPGRSMVPLRLYERAERVWTEDPELHDAHHAMQIELRRLQELYRRRLSHVGDAWMELIALGDVDRIVADERAAALEAIQQLDERHVARVHEIRAELEAEVRPLERDAVARERADIQAELAAAGAVVLDGGHVAVLHNRLALFGVPELLGDTPVIGCAGGAMLLGSRVVLYDDSPAIGRGHAEIGLPGLGLVPGVVALPDAARRLRLSDPARMLRLAHRFAPDRCVLLDGGDRLDWDGRALAGAGSRTVAEDGSLTPWGRAA